MPSQESLGSRLLTSRHKYVLDWNSVNKRAKEITRVVAALIFLDVRLQFSQLSDLTHYVISLFRMKKHATILALETEIIVDSLGRLSFLKKKRYR